MLRFTAPLARVGVAILAAVPLFAAAATAAPAAAPPADVESAYEQRLVDEVNDDRAAAGLPKLAVDPRLSEIARERDRYQIDHGYFSHCVDGSASCPAGQLQFALLLQRAGFPPMWEAENLAANNDRSAAVVDEMNSDWLASPHHHEQIVNPVYNVTGVGVVCCGTLKTSDGQAVGGVHFAAQIFARYTPAMLAALQEGTPAAASAIPAQSSGGGCRFVLGFQALHQADGRDVGGCVDDQAYAANGDAVQHTTTGMMAWRKADNWTAFTDGFTTWVNGPNGLAKRPNTQRFPWEANPQSLPVVNG